jgi:hypothetical protein
LFRSSASGRPGRRLSRYGLYLLPSLRVEVQPGSIKGTLVVRSASAPADWPLYEVYAKPGTSEAG